VPFEWSAYALLFVVAMAAGFVDAIAGGGGLLTVPALLGVGLPPAVALGTNKLQSSCGTALATWTYARAGLLPGRELAGGLALTFAAALAGTWAVTLLSPDLLRRLIPALLLGVAAYTWFKPELGREARPARLPRPVFLVVFAPLLGFYDGFLGPGTGAFWMLALVALQGLDFRAATGHTKAFNLTSNLASLTAFAAAGQVHLPAGAVMAAGQLVGAWYGARLAVRVGGRLIRPLFLTVVLLLTTKLLWDSLRGPFPAKTAPPVRAPA
jgi:uncharacterized protein